MATSSSWDLKGEDEIRHEILSYTPGKAVPCDDERVMFPDKLAIGMVDLCGYGVGMAHALRCALHGDVEPGELADNCQTSTEDQEEYMTDSISVIMKYSDGTLYELEEYGKDIAGKVGCMVMIVSPATVSYYTAWIGTTKTITGRVPLCALILRGDVPKARYQLEQVGITDIYEVDWPNDYMLADDEYLQYQWLRLLHGCIQEGDRALALDDLKKICTNSRCELLNEKTKKEAKEVNQKIERRCEALVNKNVILKSKIIREQEQREQVEITMSDNEKLAKHAIEMYKQRVLELEEIVVEKERNETTLKQQYEESKKGRERDSSRFEKEKQSMELSWMKELDYKEQLMEQLERETWKLRTKIQLESEIRSAEQKKKAEKHQWNFIPWVNSGEHAQGGTSPSSEYNSTGGLGRNILRAGEEPPDDEFADILKQIADDLYDEAKIDSLGGQLGILHGDIQRALMTNMRFNRVTSDGTRELLKQWRKGVSREEERMELKRALQAAKLVNIADLYLREDTQLDTEYVNEDANDQQLSTGDKTSLEQYQTKGHDDIQVRRGATVSNDHTPRDGHRGDTASKIQEDLTDGSRSQHPYKSPKCNTESFNAPEVTSEDVPSEVAHAGDDMTNLRSIQPSEPSSIYEMQVLPEDMSDIAPLVSSGEKPNEHSTILDESHVGGIISNEEDLISQFLLIDTSPEKILLLFLVKIIMDVPQKALNL